MSRRLPMLAVAALAAASAAPAARAAGPEALALYGVTAGPGGVSTPKSPFRYVSLPARRGTVVAKIRRDGGQVVRWLMNDRGFSVPAVAADGSASGLSADGRMLVLVPPRVRFPQRVTRLAIVDTERFRITRTVELLGDFNFDAISPDGNLLYLIEFQSRRNPLDYAVRVYDLRTRRLDPKPVVDPREADEEMRGFPVTRATSPDGRWAYTLYQGGEHPFIHALDTVGRTARCIDLPHGTRVERRPRRGRSELDRAGRRITVRERWRTGRSSSTHGRSAFASHQ